MKTGEGCGYLFQIKELKMSITVETKEQSYLVSNGFNAGDLENGEAFITIFPSRFNPRKMITFHANKNELRCKSNSPKSDEV